MKARIIIVPLLLVALAAGAETPATPPSIVISDAPPRILDPGTVAVSTNVVGEVTQRVYVVSGARIGQQFSVRSSNPAWSLAKVESETPSVCIITNGNFISYVADGIARIVAHFTNSGGALNTASISQPVRSLGGNFTNATFLAVASNSLAAAILRSSLALTNGQIAPAAQASAYAEFSSSMQFSFGAPPPDPKWTNWVYTRNTNFWLNGVRGLDALNVFPYQMQLALVTPRHCLAVEHMRGCGSNVMVCFVGTNNSIYWRRSLGTVAIADRLRACILDAPVPIAPMPLIDATTLATKIGMLKRPDYVRTPLHNLPLILFNQQWQAWAGDAAFIIPGYIAHTDRSVWLNAWSWAVPGNPAVVGGDSGSARCLVIDNQLYLAGVAQSVEAEVSMYDIGVINAALDQLSAQTRQPKNHVTVFDASRYPSY